MRNNKLKQNPDKTEFFIIASPYNQKRISAKEMDIGGEIILPAPSAKVFGAIINSTLSMRTLPASVVFVLVTFHGYERFVNTLLRTSQKL